jgi:hypothetical protein
METDHHCFMTLPPGAADSYKTSYWTQIHQIEWCLYCIYACRLIKTGRFLEDVVVPNVVNQLTWIPHQQKQSSPATRHGGAWGERRYSSYSFLSSALDGVSGKRHAQAALCHGERTPSTHSTGGWVYFRAGLDTEVREKILCPCRGSNPNRPVVQSIDRHYTDWAMPAPTTPVYHQNRWHLKLIKNVLDPFSSFLGKRIA